ncbi:MAG: hypothetical protein NTW20_14280 [Rhodobacterales bacterium]|nr:hypothetical protein [Rhodobacterales bacterium]
MADINLTALYGSVVEDEGLVFIGFAEGEDEEECYVMFRQAASGGPVWFEVNDEEFGAEDALKEVTSGPTGLEITLKADAAATFGWAQTVAVRIGPDCEDAAPALEALQGMLGSVWRA